MTQESNGGLLPGNTTRTWEGMNAAVLPLPIIAQIKPLLEVPPDSKEFLHGLQITSYKDEEGGLHILTWGGDYGVVITSRKIEEILP